MKRYVQATLCLILAAAGLVGLGLLAINLYVQSPGTQLRLREIVSENLGYPVSVFRISFTPWNGFHLQDFSIQDPLVEYPILKAQDLWIQCNYLPLLRRKLIVRHIFLSGAEIRIPTTARLESEAETDELPSIESLPHPNPDKESPPVAHQIWSPAFRKSHLSQEWHSWKFLGGDPQIQDPPGNRLFLGSERTSNRDSP